MKVAIADSQPLESQGLVFGPCYTILIIPCSLTVVFLLESSYFFPQSFQHMIRADLLEQPKSLFRELFGVSKGCFVEFILCDSTDELFY